MGNGFITARSDETRLYILIDLLADTGNDSVGDDSFWLSFDLLDNLQIDSGWDLNFRLDSSGDFILEEYSGPDSFSPRNSTNLRSLYGSGFDCYLSDGSAEVTFVGFIPNFSCSKHRIFEIAIDLQTIGAEPGDLVRLGVRAISQSPAFSEDNPPGFTTDFSELGAISLAPSRLEPTPPSGAVTGIGSNGFEVEVTQAIQDVNNSLRLVADKETVVRVYPEVADEALVRTFLFGRRNGQDLPGSPLVTLATIPSSIDREVLSNTSNFLLPASWVTDGLTEFIVIAENLGGQNPQVVSKSAIFLEQRIPEIWVFPFNLGSPDRPILPTNADMVAQEQVLKRLLPTPSVTFIHRPWTDIGTTGYSDDVLCVNTANRASTKGEVTPYPDQGSISIPMTSHEFSLRKCASPAWFDKIDDVINYTYTVTSSGTSLVEGPITVKDSKITTVDCPEVSTIGNSDGNLDPGEELVCTASYTVVGDDFDTDSITNTARAFGNGGSAISSSDSVTIKTDITFSAMKKELNDYWTMLALAKILSGDISTMPDLLYGFKVSRDPKAVGTSDPVYTGGNGRVVVGQADGRDFNTTTMVHEVNHDLDRSKTGTWGRHVANPANVKDRSWGCDAGSNCFAHEPE